MNDEFAGNESGMTGGGQAMQSREQQIRARFAEQSCVACGTHYLPESVVVLARRTSMWMVMARCYACEHRGVFVVSFPAVQRSINGTHDAVALIPSPLPLPDDPAWPSADETPGEYHGPVTLEDVQRVRDFLSGFNGDFRTLFRQR